MENLNQNEMLTKYLHNIIKKTEAKKNKILKKKNHVFKIIEYYE